jgi:nitroreductase
MGDMSVFEAIDRLRAAWRFRPDPVPEADLRRILEAATRAASGGNAQPWRFVVVRDAELRRRIGELYQRAWRRYRGAVERTFGDALGAQGRSMIAAAEALAERFAEVPVHLVVGAQKPPPGFELREESGEALDVGTIHSSIYPAVQNVILAATALGLATRLITLHRIHEEELKRLLGIPDGVETMALLPIGYPDGTFRRRPRLPIERVTHWDRWSETPRK